MALDHFQLAKENCNAESSHPISRFLTDWWNESQSASTEPGLRQLKLFYYGLTAGRIADWAIFGNHDIEYLADLGAYMLKLGGNCKGFDYLLLEYLRLRLDWEENGNAAGYEMTASRFCEGRRLLITLLGHIGIGPAATRTGDCVCVYHLVTKMSSFFVLKVRTTSSWAMLIFMISWTAREWKTTSMGSRLARSSICADPTERHDE